jgi:hypothetical protein
MADSALPGWEGDPLSAFLADAQRNERVSALKLPDVYALLQRVHATFQQVAEITEKEHSPNLLPTRFLMARAHPAWLAAVHLGLSSQTVEVYPVLRAVIEDSWYALHLAKDPNPPTRLEIWFHRDDDAPAKARCRTEFTIGNVRATHAALDPATEAALHALYERTIDFGAHPNQRGILAAMIRTDTSQSCRSFGSVYLTNNPILIVAALKTAVEVAVGALKTFRLIFPERFAIMGMDDEIEKLVYAVNTISKSYVPQGA